MTIAPARNQNKNTFYCENHLYRCLRWLFFYTNKTKLSNHETTNFHNGFITFTWWNPCEIDRRILSKNDRVFAFAMLLMADVKTPLSHAKKIVVKFWFEKCGLGTSVELCQLSYITRSFWVHFWEAAAALLQPQKDLVI